MRIDFTINCGYKSKMNVECGAFTFGNSACISACISVCISVGCVVVASEGTETRLQEKEVRVFIAHLSSPCWHMYLSFK